MRSIVRPRRARPAMSGAGASPPRSPARPVRPIRARSRPPRSVPRSPTVRGTSRAPGPAASVRFSGGSRIHLAVRDTPAFQHAAPGLQVGLLGRGQDDLPSLFGLDQLEDPAGPPGVEFGEEVV